MELAAERTEPLFEVSDVEVQLPGNAEKRKIVALTAERQDLRALRAEVHVDRRAAAAGSADLNRRGRGGGHFTLFYAPKELPQPQVAFAFGLLKTNPLLIRLVS